MKRLSPKLHAIVRSILPLLILVLAGCSNTPETAETTKAEGQKIPTYRIGYMICNSEKETLQRFLPMSEYLGKRLGVKFETVAIDTINFTREIDKLDFTHTNSLLYVILQRFNGVSVLAAEKKDSLGHLSQGVIITRKNSEIKTIADLRGKTMLFGPMLAPTGFMAQVDLMQSNGIDPERDLASYSIPSGSFKHEKVVYGVLFDKFDAGSLPVGDIENMIQDGRIGEDEVNILAKAEPIPYCNFGVTQKIDEHLAVRFKEAVLSLTPADTVAYEGETVRVLKRALVDGYLDIADKDFDIVRDMARRTNMPPYQQF